MLSFSEESDSSQCRHKREMGEAISIIPQSLVFNHSSTILTMERKIKTKTKYLETARHSSTPVIPALERLRQNYEFETLRHTMRPYLRKKKIK